LTGAAPTLSIWVRSSDGGDAVAWLLDAKYHVLASNDDADDSTLDSHLTYDLPAGGASGPLRGYRHRTQSSAESTQMPNAATRSGDFIGAR
jgi:hypothetical protein